MISLTGTPGIYQTSLWGRSAWCIGPCLSFRRELPTKPVHFTLWRWLWYGGRSFWPWRRLWYGWTVMHILCCLAFHMPSLMPLCRGTCTEGEVSKEGVLPPHWHVGKDLPLVVRGCTYAHVLCGLCCWRDVVVFIAVWLPGLLLTGSCCCGRLTGQQLLAVQ